LLVENVFMATQMVCCDRLRKLFAADTVFRLLHEP